MSEFETNEPELLDILKGCRSGSIQLPDFQRGWVWDEERIISLISSVSQAFPIGALLVLKTGGRKAKLKPRPIEGAEEEVKGSPEQLILDGQQRVTSLYQATFSDNPVTTKKPKSNRKMERWFYFDIRKSIDASVDRESSIISLDRKLGSEEEYKELMFPISRTFDAEEWRLGCENYWREKGELDNHSNIYSDFSKHVLNNFHKYDVPIICLKSSISMNQVCTIFVNLNTGGKELDAFELVTAKFAAEGKEDCNLREDWFGKGKSKNGRRSRLADLGSYGGSKNGVFEKVRGIDFLQVISLMSTHECREEDKSNNKEVLRSVSGKRQALLELSLEDYQRFEESAENGYSEAVKFLHMLNIYRYADIPYKPQLIPLVAILSRIGEDWTVEATRKKLTSWFWCGVFGEKYSAASETQMAWDMEQVPDWINGGSEPYTVRDSLFQIERLELLQSKRSAAYKGVNALLMERGACDFASGLPINIKSFFEEAIDIHHIFPKKWCELNAETKRNYNSIINKTPIAKKTNSFISDNAPSKYVVMLEKGNSRRKIEPVDKKRLKEYLLSHLIDPTFFHDNDLEGFMKDREKKLHDLILNAMGKNLKKD